MSGSHNPASKEYRERCWAARDAHYVCEQEGGSCEETLRLYEASCPPSWIRHFSQSRRYEREKAARVAAIEAQNETFREQDVLKRRNN